MRNSPSSNVAAWQSCLALPLTIRPVGIPTIAAVEQSHSISHRSRDVKPRRRGSAPRAFGESEARQPLRQYERARVL